MNPKTMQKWAKIVSRVEGYVVLATLIAFCKEEWLNKIIENPDEYIAPWLPKEGGLIPLIITAGLQFLFQLGALRAEVAPDKVALRIKLDDILQGERGEPVTPTMGAVGREMDERNQYAETVQQGDADRVQLSQADTKRLVEELMQAAGTPLEPSIAKWMIDASLRLGGPAAALTAMIGSMYQQKLMPANGALFTIAFIGITYGRGKAAWKAEDQTIVEKLCSWLSTIVQGVSTLMIAAALIPEFDHLSRHVEGNPAWEKATMFGELRTATALYGASMALGPERDAIVKAPGRIYSAGKWVGGLFASACAACRGYQSIGGGVSVTYEETDAKVDAEVGAGYGATHSALGMTLGSGE